MTVKLKHDRGTLIAWELPEVIAPLFQWDARSQLYRAPGQCYRQVVETLREKGVKHQDEATEFKTLELRVSREVAPYSHQTEALAAWKQAVGRVWWCCPTGAGKTFVAQLAMRDTPRSTLICVPTIDLLHQWYSGLLATFPDANIGLLGGGSKDETPILIATYDSATIYAEELANKYALIVFDEAHHLPAAYTRVIAEMSLAPYRLGLTATPKRSDGREADLDTLIGPVVYQKSPSELKGDTLADYQDVKILVRLSAHEQARYDELIQLRNDFLWRMHIKLGSIDGWQKFINASGTQEGRKAMLAHREARAIAFGTEGKLRVLEEILANHPKERTLIFTDDNAMVYKISREFFIPAITHQTPGQGAPRPVAAVPGRDLPHPGDQPGAERRRGRAGSQHRGGALRHRHRARAYSAPGPHSAQIRGQESRAVRGRDRRHLRGTGQPAAARRMERLTRTQRAVCGLGGRQCSRLNC